MICGIVRGSNQPARRDVRRLDMIPNIHIQMFETIV
jgi:hypothetical protein